jgi:hypothetical protein
MLLLLQDKTCAELELHLLTLKAILPLVKKCLPWANLVLKACLLAQQHHLDLKQQPEQHHQDLVV